MGVQIYVFESELGKNGKHIGKNGWYDPRDNSIHIDLHAGQNGEGTMLFTLAHELTHHIRKWSPAKFKILADFLMEEYGKLGVNVDGLIREQMAKAKRGGRTISYDTAYEEMVADSMETMLADGNVIKRLAKLKARDQGLWQKIKDFIDELATKIRNVYKGLKADSVEGRYVADMGKTVYRLQEMFAEALVDASENFQSAEVQKNTTEEGGVEKYSQRYLEADTNSEIIAMVNRVANGAFRANEKVYLENVSDAIADQIYNLTGIRVNGFKIAIEARQIDHILQGHGENGDTDHSMADPDDIAKMEYALNSPDDIRKAGKTQAYTYMRNGRNRTADTVLYEKKIGAKSYYVVQAVPDTKAKTLYIVTAFIGQSGYKKEAPQLINAKDPDATAKTGSVNASKNSIRNEDGNVKNESAEAVDLEVDAKTESVAPSPLFSERTWTEAEIAEEQVEQADRDLEAEVKYSLRDVKVPTRAELEKKDPIKVIDISSSQTKGTYAERRRQILKNAEKIIAKPYLNRDTKTWIFLTKDSYTHAFKNTGTIQLNAAEHIPELIGNAVLTHAEAPTHGSDYTDGVYTFFAAARAGHIMPVKLKVKEYGYVGQLLPKNIRDYFESNPGDYASSYDTVVLEVEEIEENPPGSVRDIMKHDIAPDPEEFSTIKVSDLLSLVKGEYEKYLPKFSDRDTESVSNRSLLAEALESVAQTDWDLEAEGISDSAGPDMGVLYSNRDVTSWDINWDEDNHSTIKSQMVKHMAEINRMNPVADIEFDKSKGKTYANILDEVLRTKFGYKIDRADGASFLFDKVAIATLRRYVGSDEEAAAVTAAPYVLKRGKAISGHKNHKNLGNPSVTYAGPVTINGERVNVGVVVLFGDKNRPHSLRVLMPSGKEYVLKKTETDPKRKGASPNGGVRSSTGSASKLNVAQNEMDVKKYSDRDTESVSNRSLLAEALESVAQTDWEKQKLQEYKGKIRQIEDQEQKLRDLNRQIKELSFAKGPRDKAKLSALRDEATKTANRINILDKQLLRLEASKPLQAVLEREKKKAYRRAEQKGKEALAEYREKATKTQREMLERWQDSRKKGIESRQSSYVRSKIKAFKPILPDGCAMHM